jgi:ABC-2 type transport system permease protein
VASRIFIHQGIGIGSLLSSFVGCLLITMVFGTLAFALGTMTGRRSLAMGITSAVAIASYLINSLAPAVQKLESADKATIFHYYNSGSIATHGLNWTNIILQLVIIVMLLLTAWSVFDRRDIHNES